MRWATSPGEGTYGAMSDRCATGLRRAAGLRTTIAFARGMLHNRTNGSQSGALLGPKKGAAIGDTVRMDSA